MNGSARLAVKCFLLAFIGVPLTVLLLLYGGIFVLRTCGMSGPFEALGIILTVAGIVAVMALCALAATALFDAAVRQDRCPSTPWFSSQHRAIMGPVGRVKPTK